MLVRSVGRELVCVVEPLAALAASEALPGAVSALPGVAVQLVPVGEHPAAPRPPVSAVDRQLPPPQLLYSLDLSPMRTLAQLTTLRVCKEPSATFAPFFLTIMALLMVLQILYC